MFDLTQIVQPYTMATPERVKLVIELCERAISEELPGDFVECGVWNGGLSAILAYHGYQRTTWLFDSFQGLPAIGPNDVASTTGHPAEAEVGKAVGSKAKVLEVLGRVPGCGNLHIVDGWFADTFPKVDIPQIAVLLLDSDWYESEKLCLEKFYDSVVEGGFIYFDDWFYWPGARWAAMEFLGSRMIDFNIFETNRVGHSTWIQKRRGM